MAVWSIVLDVDADVKLEGTVVVVFGATMWPAPSNITVPIKVNAWKALVVEDLLPLPAVPLPLLPVPVVPPFVPVVPVVPPLLPVPLLFVLPLLPVPPLLVPPILPVPVPVPLPAVPVFCI